MENIPPNIHPSTLPQSQLARFAFQHVTISIKSPVTLSGHFAVRILIHNSETHSKPSHFVSENTRSPSKTSMSQRNVKSYMKTTNGGGDPVTALSLRPSSSTSAANRQAKVEREMAASLAVLNKTQ
ncbi:hypothetical protein PG994_002449 [Apiospora phragmitis]|uniref:Uncharacterized protein n=1 Tax=Apiospora phragmitis TaxID=2905665 RepID=A0ABR1WWD1_9PEZI